ncbi:MAG: low-specificity L-threonine aldolase [Granulosicoccus sp.]
MSQCIDLRSDTVTRPTEAMRIAMMKAPVGDDVYGDDPTVNELQSFSADLLGHEAALFMPSGTQSNLVALLTHCQRGDEYIAGADAHTYKYEGGGAAALGGIQPQTVTFDEDGGLNLDQVASVIKADDVHFAKTRLLCLENTQHGRVQSVERMRQAQTFAKAHGLKLHLDGARMANACVALGVELKVLAECCDTVSLCLSKGLGAPIGSLLFGSQDFINQAKRWRKVTGGGWRQAGLLAAAGQLALTDGFARMHEDHENARFLANSLQGIKGVSVRRGWTQTNMVWLDYEQGLANTLKDEAKREGILLSAYEAHCRLVTHANVTREHLEKVVNVFGRVCNSGKRPVSVA